MTPLRPPWIRLLGLIQVTNLFIKGAKTNVENRENKFGIGVNKGYFFPKCNIQFKCTQCSERQHVYK